LETPVSGRRSIWFGVVRMLGVTAPVGLGLGVIGLWATWVLAGGVGLAGEAIAGLIALTAVTACGAATLRSARRGPGRAAFTFVVASSVASVGAVVGAVAMGVGIPRLFAPLLIWVAVFCFSMLLTQSLWLSRGLKRDGLRDFQEREDPTRRADPPSGQLNLARDRSEH